MFVHDAAAAAIAAGQAAAAAPPTMTSTAGEAAAFGSYWRSLMFYRTLLTRNRTSL